MNITHGSLRDVESAAPYMTTRGACQMSTSLRQACTKNIQLTGLWMGLLDPKGGEIGFCVVGQGVSRGVIGIPYLFSKLVAPYF